MILEKSVVSDLIERENLVAQREFHVEHVGFIDILTKDCVIEVKELDSWKHALGQVLAYSAALPGNRKKRIHLFKRDGSSIDPAELEIVERICLRFDVFCTFEGGTYVVRKHRVDRTLSYLDKFRFKGK